MQIKTQRGLLACLQVSVIQHELHEQRLEAKRDRAPGLQSNFYRIQTHAEKLEHQNQYRERKVPLTDK